MSRRQQRGAPGGVDDMFCRTYVRLRGLAAGYSRKERRLWTLQPTAVVHEAYLRLSSREGRRWRNRAHFLSFAARVMRQILVDAARGKGARKRGAGERRITFDEALALGLPKAPGILDLERALAALESLDRRKARIVEMRFFGGMTVPEVALALEVSSATVNREWRAARAWLGKRLETPPAIGTA